MLTDLQYVLGAGKEATIPLNNGRYLRLARTSLASGRLRVRSDRGDDVYLTVGRGVFLDVEARNAYVSNEEASAQTFTLVNGADSDIDFSLAGGVVAVENSGSLDGVRFKFATSFQGATCPALQVKNSSGAGSNVYIVLESVRALSEGGNALLAGATGDLATLFQNNLHNKLLQNAHVTGVQVRREDLEASPGGPMGITRTEPDVWYDLVGAQFSPFVLPPAVGFTVHIPEADTLHVQFEGRRIVV